MAARRERRSRWASHQAVAEMILPDPVDHHARGQRICWTGDPLGQAPCRRRVDVHRSAAREYPPPPSAVSNPGGTTSGLRAVSRGKIRLGGHSRPMSCMPGANGPGFEAREHAYELNFDLVQSSRMFRRQNRANLLGAGAIFLRFSSTRARCAGVRFPSSVANASRTSAGTWPTSHPTASSDTAQDRFKLIGDLPQLRVPQILREIVAARRIVLQEDARLLRRLEDGLHAPCSRAAEWDRTCDRGSARSRPSGPRNTDPSYPP